MIELRPFTKNDWYGFAGAEPFPDDSEPLIGEMGGIDYDLDGTPVTVDAIVILDARGLCIIFSEEEIGEVASIHFGAPWAARAMTQLRDGLSFVALRAIPGAEMVS